MTMGDSEIKNLFVRANAQVHIDEARKQKTHQAMMMEMDKQEINKQRMEMMMSIKIFCFSNFSIWINCFSIFMEPYLSGHYFYCGAAIYRSESE